MKLGFVRITYERDETVGFLCITYERDETVGFVCITCERDETVGFLCITSINRKLRRTDEEAAIKCKSSCSRS